MGIIRAAAKSLSSGLADQWLEVIEPSDMGAQTLMTPGIMVNRKSQNRKGSRHVISDGSVIHVYDNQLMILTDGGKIIDYTAEPGYFEVNNAAEPSLFNGDFSGAMQATFERVKYGGQSPTEQKVYYLNLQEIKGIKFGTRNPINYFDNFYNAELFLRTHGTYSIRITDPLRFYAEVIPRNMDQVEVSDVNEQFLDEFLEALQSAINQMSADGIRISFVTSKGRELGKYMADILDEEWKQNRGVEIASVGIASISYDEESTKLINMRNQGLEMSLLKRLSSEGETEMANRSKESYREENAQLKKRIKELEKSLSFSRLETEARDLMITRAEEYFNIQIRKKSGAK